MLCAHTIKVSRSEKTSVCSDGLTQSSEVSVDTVARSVDHAVLGRVARRCGQTARIGLVGVPHQIVLQFLVAQTEPDELQ